METESLISSRLNRRCIPT